MQCTELRATKAHIFVANSFPRHLDMYTNQLVFDIFEVTEKK